MAIINLNHLKQAAKAAIDHVKGNPLDPKQAEVAALINDGLAPFKTPPVQNAFAEFQKTQPDHDYLQVRGVKLRAPAHLDGTADPHTYTRMGISSTAPGTKPGFSISLYDAVGQPPSNAAERGGPSRNLHIEGDRLNEFIRANRVQDVGFAFTTLFDDMRNGAGGGWSPD